MAQVKTRRSREFYRQLVDEYQRGGRTQAEVAAEAGIPSKTLSAWVSRFRREAEGSTCAGAVQDSGQASLVPVRLAQLKDYPSGEYELQLGKATLKLPADFDPQRVGTLLRVVEAMC